MGNLHRYFAHLPGIATFLRPARNTFESPYGPAQTPRVRPWLSTALEVRAKMALDHERQRPRRQCAHLPRMMCGASRGG